MFFNVIPQRRLPPATEANIETKVAIYTYALHRDSINNGYLIPAFMSDFFAHTYRSRLQAEAFTALEDERLAVAAAPRPNIQYGRL